MTSIPVKRKHSHDDVMNYVAKARQSGYDQAVQEQRAERMNVNSESAPQAAMVPRRGEEQQMWVDSLMHYALDRPNGLWEMRVYEVRQLVETFVDIIIPAANLQLVPKYPARDDEPYRDHA